VRKLVVALSVLGCALAVSTSAGASAAPMPTPQKLTKVLVFDFNGIRLSPPPTNVRPSVSPAEAWKAAHVGGASAYRLVLAQWTSNVPPGPSAPTQALVWLIFGTHVREPLLGPGTHRVSALATAMWLVDATTDQSYGTYEFPPKEVSNLNKDLRPYMG